MTHYAAIYPVNIIYDWINVFMFRGEGFNFITYCEMRDEMTVGFVELSKNK